MQDKINFRLWLELDARSTFDSVKKDFLLQIIPIKVKNRTYKDKLFII